MCPMSRDHRRRRTPNDTAHTHRTYHRTGRDRDRRLGPVPTRAALDRRASQRKRPQTVSPASATSRAPAAAVLATGRFHSVAHTSMGTAAIHQLADGRRVLRFTDFETSNGPDVHVYLVAAGDVADSATVTRAGF